jgi:hypothetical protein
VRLTPDQQRFASRVAELATIDPAIAAAWVAAASGPGVDVAGYRYLEPGHPGFPSLEHAARSAATRLRTGPLVSRLGAGPLALIRAIGDDPEWPGTHEAIVNVWASS